MPGLCRKARQKWVVCTHDIIVMVKWFLPPPFPHYMPLFSMNIYTLCVCGTGGGGGERSQKIEKIANLKGLSYEIDFENVE
jgi:hypothetical protein